jgi:hypothetical protein
MIGYSFAVSACSIPSFLQPTHFPASVKGNEEEPKIDRAVTRPRSQGSLNFLEKNLTLNLFIRILPAARYDNKGDSKYLTATSLEPLEKIKLAILLEMVGKNLPLCIFPLAFYGAESYIDN